MTSPSIDVVTLLARLDAGDALTVVDVRTPAEYESAHIAGAVNVPLDVLTANAAEVAEHLAGHPQGSVVLVCQSGQRAEQARRRLAGVGGLTDLPVLAGGTSAYVAAGGDTTRGRERWGLERQVRLVAGGIVLASIVASLWQPRARFLAGGIGAGLSFSAVSDTCAMGSVLSRLPYNQAASPPAHEAVAALRPA